MSEVVALRENTEVDLLEQARNLLVRATSVDEVKDIRDRAEALRAYAKQAGMGLEAQNRAAEVKLRAERRAGELIAQFPKSEGGRGKTNDSMSLVYGIERHQSSRWQRIASLPDETFESYISSMLESRREVTTSGALKLAKQTRETVGPNGYPALPGGKFRTITADPPWRYGNTSTRGAAQDHYETLSIEQLCGDETMPDGTNLAKEVQDRAAAEAHLYMWTTAGHLPESFRVMASWGFEYRTYLVWVKPQMGMGNYFRVSTELVLFGIRGGMRTNSRSLKNYFTTKRGKHSAKPESFYDDVVMEASPGPYLEMFTRCRKSQQLICGCTRCRLGWEVWGNES